MPSAQPEDVVKYVIRGIDAEILDVKTEFENRLQELEAKKNEFVEAQSEISTKRAQQLAQLERARKVSLAVRTGKPKPEKTAGRKGRWIEPHTFNGRKIEGYYRYN